MRHLTLGFIGLSGLAAFSLNGCVEKVGDDCTFTETCPPKGGSGGDGDTGGTSSTGGKGTGASDTGGAGGGTKPACDPACSGDTPVCDEAAKECVGCLNDGDCDGNTPLCDTDLNACVACLGNSDCSSDIPVCEAGECGKCTTNEDCAGRADAMICEEASGACVECTPSTDDRTATDDACGNGVCNPAINTCDDSLTQGTKDLCQPCIADNECLPGQNCIPLEYTGGAETAELGGFCMKLFPGCARPYAAGAINRASLSGASAMDYCGIAETATTCQAIADLKADKDCDSNSDCGSEHGEGRCEVVNGSAELKCTYSCTGNAQCEAGFDCGGIIGSEYCGG